PDGLGILWPGLRVVLGVGAGGDGDGDAWGHTWLMTLRFSVTLRVRFPCFLVSFIMAIMLAKKTIKNQITLPKAVVSRFRGVDYFDVSTDGSSIVLRPLKMSRADEVREKL